MVTVLFIWLPSNRFWNTGELRSSMYLCASSSFLRCCPTTNLTENKYLRLRKIFKKSHSRSMKMGYHLRNFHLLRNDTIFLWLCCMSLSNLELEGATPPRLPFLLCAGYQWQVLKQGQGCCEKKMFPSKQRHDPFYLVNLSCLLFE